MKSKQMRLFIACAASSLIAGASYADTRTSQTDELRTRVNKASEVYRAVVHGDKEVPASVLSQAKCVAIFPEVGSAAIVIGGTHGNGVAFCKNSTEKWSSPIFLDLTGGSFGLQAGAKKSDIVLFMNGSDAPKKLKAGRLSLTGELSASAGSYDSDYQAPPAGMISYARTEGVFAGAALNGNDISIDKDNQRAFYGGYDSAAIFDEKVPDTLASSVNELEAMLPS